MTSNHYGQLTMYTERKLTRECCYVRSLVTLAYNRIVGTSDNSNNRKTRSMFLFLLHARTPRTLEVRHQRQIIAYEYVILFAITYRAICDGEEQKLMQCK